MKSIFLIATFITLTSVFTARSQTNKDMTIPDTTAEVIRGLVLDVDKQIPLPYANIYVLNKNRGLITNEMGHFKLNIENLTNNDTVRFQYIGYKTRNISIGQLYKDSVVYLEENIILLRETLIFGNAPDPEFIVKNVIKNKESNYKKTTSKKQTFIRKRDISDIDKITISHKKSTINELNKDVIKMIENKIPRHSTSYTDFLGYLYFTKQQEDSVSLKVDPVRTVALKEEEIAELEQMAKVFEDILASTGEKEYWKIKSGVFSQKLDIDGEAERDTLNENKWKLKYFNSNIKYNLKYSTLNKKSDWEFLYNTGKYNYILAGGTHVNGEDVYIIDFTPKSKGVFVGRMYITVKTFALIRADYEYAAGRYGRDFQLLGVGYKETGFTGSIYFEKKDDNYLLKYFSRKENAYVAVNRSLALLKKSKRWLFDKKQEELKVRIDISLKAEGSIEYLVLEDTRITEQLYGDFRQPEYMDIIYVDQFNDKLWRGFSTIEPTKQMREYKKQDINYAE